MIIMTDITNSYFELPVKHCILNLFSNGYTLLTYYIFSDGSISDQSRHAETRIHISTTKESINILG